MVHRRAGTNREDHLEQPILTTEHPKHDAPAPCFFHALFALDCKGAFFMPILAA